MQDPRDEYEGVLVVVIIFILLCMLYVLGASGVTLF